MQQLPTRVKIGRQNRGRPPNPITVTFRVRFRVRNRVRFRVRDGVSNRVRVRLEARR